MGPDGLAFEWRRRIYGLLESHLKRPISIEDNSVVISAIVAGTTGAGTIQMKESIANALKLMLPAQNTEIQIITDI